MFTRYRSKISPVENLRGTYCLHGTVSFFAQKYLLFTRNRLFEIVLTARSFFSAIYHVNMRRSILFSVMAPKRKVADDEESDSNDSFVKFSLLILKFLRYSSANTAPFIKLSHQRDVRPGLTQCFLCFF